MTAGVLEPAPDGTVSSLRLAVGSCSAVARRLHALEDALRGRPIDGGLQEAVAETTSPCSRPSTTCAAPANTEWTRR